MKELPTPTLAFCPLPYPSDRFIKAPMRSFHALRNRFQESGRKHFRSVGLAIKLKFAKRGG